MTGFTEAQVQQLLRPIHSSRVLTDGKGHSHVSQQDILAHLIRVFGFGSFDIDVLQAECVFADPRDESGRRWDVCYRALVRLTVRDPDGNKVCHYENGSTATAQNQAKGDAHDLAYKSAISLSVKRAAIALGDQYGLSLYNKGQTAPLVLRTLVVPELTPTTGEQDAQDGVEQQVSLGNDEVDREDSPAREADTDVETSTPPSTDTPPGQASQAANVPSLVADIRERALAATKRRELMALVTEATAAKITGAMTTDENGRGMTLETFLLARIKAA